MRPALPRRVPPPGDAEVTMPIDAALSFLRCPQCADDRGLTRLDGSLRCPAGHSFDLARSGYVSLFPPGATKHAGDSVAMVQARAQFLAAGHFTSLARAITAAAADAIAATTAERSDHGCVIDVGAGTGYYLAAVLDRRPAYIGLALDASKSALRLAARAHPRIAAVGCDAWHPLPLKPGVAKVVLNVFAPRDGAELRRIVAPTGTMIVCTPTRDHLSELVGPLDLLVVDERKQARLDTKLSPYFELAHATGHTAALTLNHDEVGQLVAMGPSSWHTDATTLADRISRLPEPVSVTLSARIASYRPTAATSLA